MSDHTDIAKLPLAIGDIAVRETIRGIFRNPENGTPDNINQAGCLALAAQGSVVWNAWRTSFETLTSENVIKGFENKVNFDNQDFDLDDISWLVMKDFRCFSFGHCASFWEAKFKFVDFSEAKFGFGPHFDFAIFFKRVIFDDAIFGEVSSFKNAKFSGSAFFKRSRFQGDVDFSANTDGARKISGVVSFENAVFCGVANFNGRHFDDAVSFKNAKFIKSPPTFHGSELHQDTSFDGAIFPPATGSQDAARAYRTLKLAFSKQQAIREEQRFFRLEMEEEILLEKGLKRWFFKAYKIFSDYGFSIARPILLLITLWLIFAQIYGNYLGEETACLLGQADCELQSDWLGFSLRQALPLPGFDKLIDSKSVANIPIGLLAMHKTLSLVAFFLSGLALRNLFKLK